MILMLKIVSAPNGFSVRQSVTTIGIELQLQLKAIIFQQKNIIFQQTKNIFCFLEKIIFWLIFLVIFRKRQPMEDNLNFCNFFFISAEDDLWKTT